MPPAFISYAREDSAFALRLASDLKAKGAEVWLDQLDIEPGLPWDREVQRALAACTVMLLILTPTAVEKDNVMDEVDYALKKRKRIIPIIHNECEVPLRLGRLHQIDMTSDYAKGLDVLSTMLRTADGQKQTPPAAAYAATAGTQSEASSIAVEAAAQPRKPVEERKRSLRLFGYKLTISIATGAVALIVTAAAVTYLPRFRSAPRNPSASEPPAKASRAGDTKNNPKDGLTYVWIAPGTFTMGCSPGDSECDDDEKPAHNVTLTKGFWIGQTPVTQEAYERLAGSKPSNFQGARLAVETVNWNEAQSYCRAVDMRLPTEAEWEYAARAGSTASRYGALDSIAWYSADSDGKTHEVAQKQANAWGLYDMLGNVWQWVGDWYGKKYYSPTTITNPGGPSGGQSRVLRGGSWYVDPRYVRVSSRARYVPEDRISDIGFRCAGE